MELNDHRNIATRHDLFHLEEENPGMVYWHPRGYSFYRVLEDYIRNKMRRLDYEEVRTPQLLAVELWRRSGHWQKFQDNMFAVRDEQEASKALKPMSCPAHLQIFKSGQKSWRDLPKRYCEFSACHRDEASGAMKGLLRTRAFEQDDGHVMCRMEDVQNELLRVINLVREVYSELGFERFSMALSLRPEERFGSDSDWAWAEGALTEACKTSGIQFSAQPGEGAFYGPKIEFALEDKMGRSWQCGTIQLDAVLPERLGASFINKSGEAENPVMIHHAVFGSLGRFIAILLEHYEGVLPLWMAPVQVAVLPISDQQLNYAKQLNTELRLRDVRTELFSSADTLSRRLLMARELGISEFAIVGGREMSESSVALRQRKGGQETLPLDRFLDRARLKYAPIA